MQQPLPIVNASIQRRVTASAFTELRRLLRLLVKTPLHRKAECMPAHGFTFYQHQCTSGNCIIEDAGWRGPYHFGGNLLPLGGKRLLLSAFLRGHTQPRRFVH